VFGVATRAASTSTLILSSATKILSLLWYNLQAFLLPHLCAGPEAVAVPRVLRCGVASIRVVAGRVPVVSVGFSVIVVISLAAGFAQVAHSCSISDCSQHTFHIYC